MKQFHAAEFLRDLVDDCASSEREGKHFAADPSKLGPLLESALRAFSLLSLQYEALRKELPVSGPPACHQSVEQTKESHERS